MLNFSDNEGDINERYIYLSTEGPTSQPPSVAVKQSLGQRMNDAQQATGVGEYGGAPKRQQGDNIRTVE
jgi:hypothetical protein